jgi:hypothetical protein
MDYKYNSIQTIVKMSILKSTNSGRKNILLTVEYLLQNGWYYTSTEEGERDWRLAKTPLKIYKDNNHSLILFHSFNESAEKGKEDICFMYYNTDKEKSFRFDFIVKTVGDLDDIEEYWEDSCIDDELALKKLALNERAKSAVESYLKAKNIMNGITDQLTRTINNEIIKSISIPKHRLDNCKTIWVD